MSDEDDKNDTSRYDPSTMSRLDVEDYVADLESLQQEQHQPPLDVRVRRDVQRRFFMFFGVVALVSLTIGLSIHGSGVMKSDDGDGPVLLSSPPTAMVQACDAAHEDDASRLMCEDYCRVATCCRVPADDEWSCAAANEGVCAEYEKACSRLQQGATSSSSGGGHDTDAGGSPIVASVGDVGDATKYAMIPPAPSHLADTCQKDMLVTESHIKACTEVCKEFDDCCRVEGCLRANADACATYDPCNALDDATGTSSTTPAQIPPAPTHLAEVCSETNLLDDEKNVRSCRDLCKEFEDCCRRDTCLEANEEACATYDPCENLSSGSANDGADSVQEEDVVDPMADVDPADVAKYCHSSSVLTPEGIQACQEACSPVLCCLVSPLIQEETQLLREVESCSAEKGADWCDQYSSCKVLLQVNGNSEVKAEDHSTSNGGGGSSTAGVVASIPRAPSDIAERCSKSSLLTNEGFVSCKEACLVSRCCWSVEEYACAGDPPECDAYGDCVRLEGSEPGVVAVDDDDSDVVEDENVAEGQAAMGDVTGGDKPSSGIDSGTDAGKATPGKSDLEIAEQVIDTCTAAKVETSTGREACEKLCLSHLCCFAPENDCAEALGTQCLEYAACKHLINWSGRV